MADANLFTINLVTPERVLVHGLASEVILRTGEGDITFLAGHTPLVGTVEPGVVRVVRRRGRGAAGGRARRLRPGRAGSGRGRTANPWPRRTRVTLLIGVAELAEEIDVERARVALEAAEARVTELGGSVRSFAAGSGSGPGDADEPDAELVEAEAEVRRAQVRLEAVDANASATA